MSQIATIALLVIGGIPLFIYPGVIIADVMALAASGGHLRFPTSFPEWLRAYVIVGATLYPLIWVPALIRSIQLLRRASAATALPVSSIPIVFLLSLYLSYVLGEVIDG